MNEETLIAGLLTEYKKYFIYIKDIEDIYITDLFLRGILQKIKKSFEEKKEPSILEIGQGLKKEGQSRLLELSSLVIFQSDFDFAFKAVTESHRKAFLRAKATRVLAILENPLKGVDEALEEDRKTIQIKTGSVKGASELVEAGLKRFDDIVSGAYKRNLTGNIYIDNYTDGLEDGSLNIIGARPGVGKTQFAIDLIYNFPKNVLFYSLEMNKQEIARRIYARATGLNSSFLKEKSYIERNKTLILDASKEIQKKHIFGNYTTNITPDDIYSEASFLKHTKGLDLIVVDYIQIMKLGQKSESKIIEVGKISQELKSIAKALDTPIVALTQLVRGAENRTDKRPMLSDIRWAGEIEENAHKVIFLHKPAMYNKEEDLNLIEVILAKNRSGEVGGVLPFYMRGECSRFEIYSDEHKTRHQARQMQAQ